ncbi:hypothetical protein G7Y89_g5167 [Cudoniella acicularis]|uniref:Uncharacterized protein n=1 Tax=Cudoniella acicularis TaxID=354080 RepID=A0A8H4RNU1_9HELO|nr:hypothetical protein G7Y89_g5167 [Cudoniella acicularis]
MSYVPFQNSRPWGLRVPGRPPTPSEGAAQGSAETVHVRERNLLRVRTHVDQFDLACHPFCNQIALIDKAILDIKAVRDRYTRASRVLNRATGHSTQDITNGQANGYANGDTNGQMNGVNGHHSDATDELNLVNKDPFDDFRDFPADPSMISTITLESGTYEQVPSRFATIHNMVSIYAQPNKSDIPGELHPGVNSDTRFGTNARGPFETIPRQTRRQMEQHQQRESRQHDSHQPTQGAVEPAPRRRNRRGGQRANRSEAIQNGNSSRRNSEPMNSMQNGNTEPPVRNIMLEQEVLIQAQAAQIRQLHINQQRGPNGPIPQAPRNFAMQPTAYANHGTQEVPIGGYDDSSPYAHPLQQGIEERANQVYAQMLDELNNESRARGENFLRGDLINGEPIVQVVPPSPFPVFNGHNGNGLAAFTPLGENGQIIGQEFTLQPPLQQPQPQGPVPSFLVRPSFLYRPNSYPPPGFPPGFATSPSSRIQSPTSSQFSGLGNPILPVINSNRAASGSVPARGDGLIFGQVPGTISREPSPNTQLNRALAAGRRRLYEQSRASSPGGASNRLVIARLNPPQRSASSSESRLENLQ